MILQTIPAGVMAANCYIIGCEETKEGAIIDPGGDALNLLLNIKKMQLSIKYIILTHGHYDHIGGVKEIKRKTNGLLCVHRLDREMIEDPQLNLSENMGGRLIIESTDKELNDGDELSIGNIKAKIIHTPGHTKGGISILIKDAVFTGDTLFAGSIGRTDFPGGNMEDILSSIKNKIFALPENTRVFSGHGPATTIIQEKNTNPFFL